MNSKYKNIAILIVCTVLSIVIGKELIDRYVFNQEKQYFLFSFEEQRSKRQYVPYPTKNLGQSKLKRRPSSNPTDHSNNEGFNWDNNILPNTQFSNNLPRLNSSKDIIENSYSYRYHKYESFYSSNSLGVIPDYTISGKSSAQRSSNESEGNYASMSRPLAVPFANNYDGTPSTLGGTILFDPGIESENIEDYTIPAGEGWWILLLLGIGYVGFRRYRV